MINTLIVVGPPAAGKTTIASRLSRLKQIPHVQIDAIWSTSLERLGLDEGEWYRLATTCGALAAHFYESASEPCLVRSRISGNPQIIDTSGGLLYQPTAGGYEALCGLFDDTVSIMALPSIDSMNSCLNQLYSRLGLRASSDKFIQRWLENGGYELTRRSTQAAFDFMDRCSHVCVTSEGDA